VNDDGPRGPSSTAVYSLTELQDMLGMSRAVVLGYVKAGFVSPTRGPRNAYRFGFQDVVLLRTAQALKAADIPTRRIRRSLRRLEEQLPRALPLAGLRIRAVGDDVVVRDGTQTVSAETGQLLMDFEVASTGGTVLQFRGRSSNASATRDGDDWAARGEALEASDVEGAIAAYRKALASIPDHPDAVRNLGALLHGRRRLAEALALYDMAIARRPDDADLHFNRAIVLEDLGDYPRAIESYERCLAIDVGFADAHWNVGRLYDRAGAARDALRHFSAFRRLRR